MAALGGSLQTTVRGRKRRVWVGSAAISVVLHVLILLAFFSSTTSGMFMGGAGGAGGGGEAVTVSLVGPVGGIGEVRDADTSARSRTSAELEKLLQQVRQDQPETVTNRPRDDGNLSRLTKELAQSRSAAGAEDARPRKGQSGVGDSGADDQSAKAQGAQASGKAAEGVADDRGDKGHASGDMWGQIETCWRPEAAVAVTLEVVIDSGGRLALPPRILRPDGARLDERRLIAEARAIQAVAACAPFRSGAPVFGRKTYRFAFAAKR